MKKLLALALTAILSCVIIGGTITAFAEDPVLDDTVTEAPVVDEQETSLSEEDIDKIVGILQGVIEKNTNITEDDISKISQKLEEYGIEVNTKIIIIIIGSAVCVFLFAVFCIKQAATIKRLKIQNNTTTTAYNNQQALIDATDRENLAKGVSEDVCNEVAKQQADVKEELAKIHGENEVLLEQNKIILDAMKTAWGNKVPGVNAILAKAPTQASVDSLELQLKYYRDYVKQLNADHADEIILSIEKKAGV